MNTPPRPTKQQVEILLLLLTGLSTAEVAERLYLSTRTVHFHVNGLYRRVGCHNLFQAQRRVRELGLIDTDRLNTALGVTR